VGGASPVEEGGMGRVVGGGEVVRPVCHRVRCEVLMTGSRVVRMTVVDSIVSGCVVYWITTPSTVGVGPRWVVAITTIATGPSETRHC
jgi:hypothetical protein